MKKYMIIALVLVFALSSFSLAARSAKKATKYTKSVKSKLKLSKDDIAIIDKAISGDFKGLTNAEKAKLVGFLNDFKDNTSHDKSIESNKQSGKQSPGSAK